MALDPDAGGAIPDWTQRNNPWDARLLDVQLWEGRGLSMNANAWFNAALDAEEAACRARTAAERKRHGRDAIDALLAAASLGDDRAIFKLGIYYKHGEFGLLPARADLAEHWLTLAAKRDNSGAVFALGILFMETGRKAQGRKWLRAALSQGEGGAACHLGKELEATSPTRALRWYLKGAALGEPFAALCAGALLETRGSKRALLQAEALFEQAARQKFPDTEEGLGRVRGKLEALRIRAPSVRRAGRSGEE